MVLQIDSITRTSSIVPFDDPITVDIAYSGGAGGVDLRSGGSPGVVVASGGASGTFTGIVIPQSGLWNDALAISQRTIDNWSVYDGVDTDNVWLSAWPLLPSFTPTPIGDNTYSFSGEYRDWWFVFGTDDVAVPYDHWFDRTTLTHTATRVTSNPQTWVFTIPYTSISWDFGDGTTSTSVSPTHVYPRSGQYVLTVAADYSPIWLPYDYPWFNGEADVSHVFSGSTTIILPGGAGWHVGRIGMGA